MNDEAILKDFDWDVVGSGRAISSFPYIQVIVSSWLLVIDC